MGALLGKAIVKVDGEQLLTEDGATLNPGGETRTPKTANKNVVGFTEETTAPELNCNIIVGPTFISKKTFDIVGATVIFQANTGQIWRINDAFSMEPGVIDASAGTAPLKISGKIAVQQ